MQRVKMARIKRNGTMEEKIIEKHFVQRKTNSLVPKPPASLLLPDWRTFWSLLFLVLSTFILRVIKPVPSDLFSVLQIFSFSKLAQSHCVFLVRDRFKMICMKVRNSFTLINW